jgi:hypothetical protein
VRQRKVGAGHRGADHLAGDALVRGIDVGVEETDRDRLDPFRRERAAGLRDAGTIERGVHLARTEQPLVDLAREMPRHQRPMAVKQQVIGFRPVAAPDDVHVARAAGDDEPGLGTLSFDQRIDGDGRAVDQLVDRGRRQPALVDAVDHTLAELCGGGQALGLHEPPARLVEPDQIRKRAADIDRNNNHATELPGLRRVTRFQDMTCRLCGIAASRRP